MTKLSYARHALLTGIGLVAILVGCAIGVFWADHIRSLCDGISYVGSVVVNERDYASSISGTDVNDKEVSLKDILRIYRVCLDIRVAAGSKLHVFGDQEAYYVLSDEITGSGRMRSYGAKSGGVRIRRRDGAVRKNGSWQKCGFIFATRQEIGHMVAADNSASRVLGILGRPYKVFPASAWEGPKLTEHFAYQCREGRLRVWVLDGKEVVVLQEDMDRSQSDRNLAPASFGVRISDISVFADSESAVSVFGVSEENDL